MWLTAVHWDMLALLLLSCLHEQGLTRGWPRKLKGPLMLAWSRKTKIFDARHHLMGGPGYLTMALLLHGVCLSGKACCRQLTFKTCCFVVILPFMHKHVMHKLQDLMHIWLPTVKFVPHPAPTSAWLPLCLLTPFKLLYLVLLVYAAPTPLLTCYMPDLQSR